MWWNFLSFPSIWLNFTSHTVELCNCIISHIQRNSSKLFHQCILYLQGIEANLVVIVTTYWFPFLVRLYTDSQVLVKKLHACLCYSYSFFVTAYTLCTAQCTVQCTLVLICMELVFFYMKNLQILPELTKLLISVYIYLTVKGRESVTRFLTIFFA